MRIAKYDDSEMAKKTAAELTAYTSDLSNYSAAYMTVLKDPGYSWAIPYVTGHKYRFFYDKGQLDMTRMKIEVSTRWQPTDKYVLFNLPYVDNREDIDFFKAYDKSYTISDAATYFIPANTLDPLTQSAWQSGFNRNDNLVKKELEFVITGKTESSKTLQFNGVRCRENLVPWCTTLPIVSTCTGTVKLWSAASTWASGHVPLAGEDAVIPAGTIVVFDLETSPVLRLIEVNGCLSFLTDNSKD